MRRLIGAIESYVVTNVTALGLWIYLFVLNRTTVVGREHVGERRNTLLLANHQSPADGFLIGIAAYFPRCLIKPSLLPWNPVAAEHFFATRVAGWIANRWRCIPVRRGGGDAMALRRMIRALPGGTLIMFPEGKRSRDGRLGAPQPGAGYLALATGARVVPVAIDGLLDVWPYDGFRFRLFRRVRVAFGPAIEPGTPAENSASKREAAARLVGRVMEAVAAQRERLRGREEPEPAVAP